MASPEYVPLNPVAKVRAYKSPPRRPQPWMKDRPAEIDGSQPLDDQLGVPGPDPGYALAMAKRFSGQLHLQDGEKEADALRGAGEIAMKRAALRGRAPVADDVMVGLLVWGFLSENPPKELVTLRRRLFSEVHNPAHYSLLRAIPDAVPDALLLHEADRILAVHRADWRRCLEPSVRELGAIDRR